MDAARYDRVARLCRIFLPPYVRVGTAHVTITPLQSVTVALCRNSPPFAALEGAIREATAFWSLPDRAVRLYELEFGVGNRVADTCNGSVLVAGATWIAKERMFVALAGGFPWAETLFHEFGHVYAHHYMGYSDPRHNYERIWKRVHDKEEWRPWMQFVSRPKLKFRCVKCGAAWTGYDQVTVLDPAGAPDGLVRLRYECVDAKACAQRQGSWARWFKRRAAAIATKLGVQIYLGE